MPWTFGGGNEIYKIDLDNFLNNIKLKLNWKFWYISWPMMFPNDIDTRVGFGIGLN